MVQMEQKIFLEQNYGIEMPCMAVYGRQCNSLKNRLPLIYGQKLETDNQ